MKFMSKHFISDGCDQLILEPKDWTEEQFDAFKRIFGLGDTERIVITEYKLEAWTEPDLNEGDWIVACDHLNMVIAECVHAGTEEEAYLVGSLLSLKKRYDVGERTWKLYDAIMALE